MSLCPESEYRAGLTDKEFWAHVYGIDNPEQVEEEIAEDVKQLPSCDICGAVTACAYDSDGRALIHATEDDEDDNV